MSEEFKEAMVLVTVPTIVWAVILIAAFEMAG